VVGGGGDARFGALASGTQSGSESRRTRRAAITWERQQYGCDVYADLSAIFVFDEESGGGAGRSAAAKALFV
jgi:hypothetical protein